MNKDIYLIIFFFNKLRDRENVLTFTVYSQIYYNFSGKDGNKITTVIATPGQGSDRPQEVSYMDTKVIGNGSFGVVFQAKLCETGELVAIKKVLQDKRFKVGWCIVFLLF